MQLCINNYKRLLGKKGNYLLYKSIHLFLQTFIDIGKLFTKLYGVMGFAQFFFHIGSSLINELIIIIIIRDHSQTNCHCLATTLLTAFFIHQNIVKRKISMSKTYKPMVSVIIETVGVIIGKGTPLFYFLGEGGMYYAFY